LKPYKKFFEFGNEGNNWEPDSSTLAHSEGFDLRFRAEYETAEWNEQNHLIMLLCHPKVRQRLENFYLNNAHQKEIKHDAELTDWLGGGGLEMVPKCNFNLVCTRKGFTAEKTQRLPYWFAQILYADQQLPPEKKRVEWFDQQFPPSMLAAEESELANKAGEILSLLELSSRKRSTAYDLDRASAHIKAGNLFEARECLERVNRASTSTPPEDLAKAKLLLFYTCTRLGIRWLKEGGSKESGCRYLRAAECFEQAQVERPGTISENRVNGIRLFCACSLYEAGKRALKSGDWGMADEYFKASLSKEVLPPTLKSKAGKYLKQCQKGKSLVKKQTSQTTAWGWHRRPPIEKLLSGEGTDDKAPAHIYKQAKRGTVYLDAKNSDFISRGLSPPFSDVFCLFFVQTNTHYHSSCERKCESSKNNVRQGVRWYRLVGPSQRTSRAIH
jgi:hypothetical protein